MSLTLSASTANAFSVALLIALALVAAWAYATRYPSLPRRRASLLLAIRALACGALLLAALAPVLRYSSAARERNRLLVLVDHSGSMQVRDVVGGRRSRREAADSVALSLERELRGRLDVRVAAFDAALGPFGRGEETLRSEPSARASGETALGDALREAIARVDPDSVAAILVLSDGAVNRGEDPERAVGGALPVYALGFGAAADPPTAGISGVEAPAEVETGRAGTLTVTVRQGARPATRGAVRVVADGKELGRAPVALEGPGATARVAIPVTLATRGKHFLTVALDGIAGDSMRENKRRLIAVTARPPKRLLTLLAPRWDWDLRSVARAVEEDTSWAVARALPQGAADAAPPGGRASSLAEVLAATDAFAGRFDPQTLNSSRAATLERYVDRGGGALLLLDPRGMPPEPTSLVRRLGLAWRRWNRPGGAFASADLAPAGRRHDVTLLGGDAASAGATWRALPPVAVPLLLRADPSGPLEPLLAAHVEGEDVPVLLAGRLGLGRIAVLNAAGFYRWGLTASGLGSGPGAEAPFFSGLRRWLSSGSEDRPVRIVAPDITPEGRPVAVRVTVADSGRGAMAHARVSARRLDGAAPVVDQPLTATPEGDHAGSVALGPGVYALRASVSRGGRAVGSDSTRVAVGSEGIEFESLRAEPETLGRLAAGTGGRAAPAERPEPVLERLRSPEIAQARLVELDLFHNPLLFAILVGFITVEWIVRRRYHLL